VCRPGQVPNGEDLHRFMDSMVQITHSRYKTSTMLSYGWFHHGLRNTIQSCKFQYADFKLTSKDRLMLESLASSLLKNSILTKDPFREKQWLGIRLVERCVTALLKDALENGTLSWDVVICRAASLILVSSLGRSGDVTVSSGYAGKQLKQAQAYIAMSARHVIDGAAQGSVFNELLCLKFEDVSISIKEGEPTALGVSFLARFNMRQDKGQK
jgi:hypothetical protein